MVETSFIDKLAQLRATSCQDLPTPELAVLTRTTARLRRCGILNKCLQSGETAPDFSLVNADGENARLYDLLDRGPVVLNFLGVSGARFVVLNLRPMQRFSRNLIAWVATT